MQLAHPQWTTKIIFTLRKEASVCFSGQHKASVCFSIQHKVLYVFSKPRFYTLFYMYNLIYFRNESTKSSTCKVYSAYKMSKKTDVTATNHFSRRNAADVDLPKNSSR